MRAAWHSLLALALLGASLAIKVFAFDVAVDEDRGAGALALADRAGNLGFSIVSVARQPPIVIAGQGRCAVHLRVLDPHATNHAIALTRIPRGWNLAYGWRGAWHDRLPRLGPLFEYYAMREAARIGLATARAPVIIAGVPAGCPLPDAALADLRLPLLRS